MKTELDPNVLLDALGGIIREISETGLALLPRGGLAGLAELVDRGAHLRYVVDGSQVTCELVFPDGAQSPQKNIVVFTFSRRPVCLPATVN